MKLTPTGSGSFLKGLGILDRVCRSQAASSMAMGVTEIRLLMMGMP